MRLLLGVCVTLFCSVVADFPAENSISSTTANFLRCEQGKKQITIEDLCNDRKDCADNWDEALCDCTDRVRPCSIGKCRKDPHIGSSTCQKCDHGYEHDGEQCRDINECETSAPCEGRESCVNFHGGHTCISCPKGFEAKMHNERYYGFVSKPSNFFLRKLFLCDDMNDCAIQDHCANRGYCVNKVGGFSCVCPPHHEPKGGVCRAVSSEAPRIVIAEKTSLFIHDLRSSKLIETVKVKHAIVDIIAYKNSVFYAFAREIWEYTFDTKSHSLVVEFEEEDLTLMSIRKLALDWDLKRLYFLTGNSIHFVNMFGQGGPVLHHKDTITSIAVDAVARYLFYSERNLVHRIHLDGFPDSKKTIFAALPEVEHENTPTGQALVADPNLQRLYFINDRVLYSFDYEGELARVVSTLAPYARIEPFEDRIYGVYRASAVNPVSLPRIGYSIGKRVRNATTLNFNNVEKAAALTVVSVAKFPESVGLGQPCKRKDACSSDWCFHLPMPFERRCACTPGATENCTKIAIRSFRPENSVAAEINHAGLLPAPMELLAVQLLLVLVSTIGRSV
ncbi:low-density lipoprotein receptor-related protein 1B isoform X2 [Galendromus occidentalis]|nr:low-density lipoprotein receptor-related protein 1B isoform X2 [Galendromus occidentalis]